MRFNLVSGYGDILGLAYWLVQEGKEVRLFIKDDEAAEVGQNLVERANSLIEMIVTSDPREDTFIFDGIGNGVVADYLRSLGFKVIGDSILSDRLEENRDFASKIFKEYDIHIPETLTFKSWDKAKEFLSSKDYGSIERFVYKPSGNLASTSMSYVSESRKELISYLESEEEESNIHDSPVFDLQEYIEDGIAISTEGWFSGGNFVPMFNHTLERKQLMDGDIGPSSGCTGNIVWACSGECPICEATIRRLEPLLKLHNYVGPIDINSIVRSEDEIYALEFTPRFGYDAMPTLLGELLKPKVGDFLETFLSRPENLSEDVLAEGFAAGLKISIPPWPTEKFNAEKNIVIQDFDEDDYSHSYFYNIKEEDGRLCTAGGWGLLFVFTGYGNTIATALRRPYEMAERIKIPDMQYRGDLREVFKADQKSLLEKILDPFLDKLEAKKGKVETERDKEKKVAAGKVKEEPIKDSDKPALDDESQHHESDQWDRNKQIDNAMVIMGVK